MFKKSYIYYKHNDYLLRHFTFTAFLRKMCDGWGTKGEDDAETPAEG